MKLTPGLIFEVAAAAGIKTLGTGKKRAICCPFHQDRHPSAFLSDQNVFYCSRCTPERGWSLKRFREALGAGWFNASPQVARRAAAPSAKPFTARDAQAAWSACHARARNDDAIEADAEVYRYVKSRGLLEAWEEGAFGVLPHDVAHPALRSWFWSGHRLVAPLFALGGEIVGIQARAIDGAEPRTKFPAGSRVAGSSFADSRGRRLLAGNAAPVVLLGEGLADSLAYSVASPWPSLCAPGTSLAVQMVGPWAMGAEVLVALDADPAGNTAAKAVNVALHRHGARRVRRVRWPPGAKDGCDVVAQRGLAGLHELLLRFAPSEAS